MRSLVSGSVAVLGSSQNKHATIVGSSRTRRDPTLAPPNPLAISMDEITDLPTAVVALEDGNSRTGSCPFLQHHQRRKICGVWLVCQKGESRTKATRRHAGSTLTVWLPRRTVANRVVAGRTRRPQSSFCHSLIAPVFY